MIKNIWKKIQSYIKKSTGVVMALGIFVVAITIFLVGNAFAALTPTKSVIITSQKTSYENNEPGSWQVEKSGKWIAKGKARVTFDVDTTLMTEDKDTDIILVLDISGSMSGDKLERVKADSTELIESLLSNKNNNAALITFDTGSTIVSDFTNDKDYLIQEINNLEDTGNTNYYQPLVNVDKILKDYVKTDDKEVIVLFLTDGYPNEDTPNQIAQYQTLKKNYPYITINGIQYEMGETILDPIKEISDNQFFADMETLNNVLFDASVAPISYDEFKIVDYIDNDYFTLDSVDDITVSQGSVKLEEENGKQKITWSIPYFKAGRDAKLTMDLNLKDEYIEQGGIYPTNESEEIISKIINIPDEDVVSNKTPVLADNYKVTYDGNSPDGSTVSNVPDEVNYSVFDTVSLTTEEPSCVGYEFKGWEIVNKDVTRVGEDHFIMPGEDVVIRARWSKVEVSKSMNGTVNNMGDPIMKGSTWFSSSGIEKSEVTSIVTKDNLEIPATAIKYWDASAVGDGSVVAYIEDDGSGNDTYKVTIGGQGGIIANKSSGFLFGGTTSLKTSFFSLEFIDLTYLDTSQTTNMSGFFEECENLKTIVFGEKFETSNVIDFSSMFYGCENLVDLDVSKFNTSKAKDMSTMFWNCRSLIELDLSRWITSNVTDMCMMFGLSSTIGGKTYSKMESLDLSSFDTSNVTDMRDMFCGCDNLTNLNISSFDTSSVEDMEGMFKGCSNLISLNVNHFKTQKVVNMKDMFYSCQKLTSLDIGQFNTSNVTDMSGMFYGCIGLVSLNLSNFDTSNVTDMSSMFCGGSDAMLLQNINFGNKWNTSNVIDMNSMFNNCENIEILDLNFFNTEKVSSMTRMFSNCSSLRSLNLSSFRTPSLCSMGGMFEHCSNLINLDIGRFDTSNVTSFSSLFYGCNDLVGVDVSNWDTSNATSMSWMFQGCSSLIDLDVSNFKTGNVANMSYMFQSCNNLKELNVSNWDTSNVTNMNMMFHGCEKVPILDVSSWNTSNVTTMSLLFSNCLSLTELDVSNWDTSKVTAMDSMFSSCNNLTNLDLKKFNTSNVTVMRGMFSGCTNLKKLDINHFDTSKVTNMGMMFSGCRSLTALDLSSWDMSNVKYVSFESASVYDGMFSNCTNLVSLNISNANFNSILYDDYMFYGINVNVNIIVKDSDAESFIRARLDDAGLTNATVTIANTNPATQTSLFELGPREFGPFCFGVNTLTV